MQLTLTRFFFISLLTLAANASASKGNLNKNASNKNAESSVTIYAAGDIAECKNKPASESMAEKTAEIIQDGLSRDPRAVVLTLGDNTYPVGKLEEFTDCYQPTWGKFKSRTLPSPGNHDYSMPLALGYYNYFDELAGPDRRGYYAKKIGQWQVISLNSNLEGAPMQEQLLWLKQQLKDHPTRCTLAYWHHPLFSSGGHITASEVMLDAWKILVAAKADLVLAGHDHDYERFAPLNANGEIDLKNGIRSFVVGTGGAKLTPMFFAKPSTEIRNNTSHGVLKLRLNSTSYDWEFLAVEGQSFSDQGHGVCH